MKKVAVLFVMIGLFAATGVFGQTTRSEWFAKGGEYYDNGDFANAIKAYSEAINLGITNLDAWWFRGVSYFLVGNYDASIADCTKVITDAPDFSTVYMVRGDAYGAKGVYHKAATDWRAGLEKGHDPSAGYTIDKSSTADMWFLGTMYREIVINRFLGNSAVVTKYDNWLRAVCDRNNATRAEVEVFYRQHLPAYIAEQVNENASIRTVPANLLIEIKQVITNFYLSPNVATYNAIADAYARYGGWTDATRSSYGRQRNDDARVTFIQTLGSINPEISSAITDR